MGAMLLIVLAAAAQDGPADAARRLYEERILPLVRSPNPSSCAECHLGGVDLKDYLDADPARTFAALRRQGLVDAEDVDASKLLTLIGMTPEQADPGIRALRAKELAAIRDWLRLAVKDPAMLAASPEGGPAGPKVPDAVIRHARKDRLLRSFVDNIWSERMRCWSCHAPGEPPNPKAAERKRNWIEKHGEGTMLWLDARGPRESMERLIDSAIIDLEKPQRSLLLRKPTQQVKHEGGGKMHPGDRAWHQFLAFIEDLAAIRAGRYASEADLPGILRTRQWLRVRGVPVPKFGIMQVDFHRAEGDGWSAEPLAVAVGGSLRGTWQAPLELHVARTDPAFADLEASRTLPPGRYRLRFTFEHGPGKADEAFLVLDAAGWPLEDRLDPAPPKAAAREIEFPAPGR